MSSFRLPHRRLIVLLVGLTAIGPLSIDMYLPSLPTMAEDFRVDSTSIQMTLSVFFLGLIVATPFYGPLSDRFGRKPIALVGISLYILGCLTCLIAPSLDYFLIGRAIQALGSASGFVIARAIVRDQWNKKDAAQVMGIISTALGLAPFCAPILGSWLHSTWGWLASFWAMLIFGAFLFSSVLAILKETHHNLDSKALDPITFIRNYRILIRHREVMGFSLVLGMALGGMFAFVAGSSYTLIDVLKLDPSWFGVSFALVCIGYLTGGLTNSYLVSKFGIYRMVLIGSICCAISGIIAIGLAWAGIQTIAAVLAPLMGFYFGCSFIFPNATLAAILPFPRIAGSASSLVGIVQLSLATTPTVLFAYLYDGTTRPLAFLTGACGLLGLFITLWILSKRQASHSKSSDNSI